MERGGTVRAFRKTGGRAAIHLMAVTPALNPRGSVTIPM